MLSAALVLFLLAPLILLVAVLIKTDSPGPSFFWQTRIGKGGREFKLLKFRTFSIEEDHPRVTRVGGFLRRASLDELPTLFNVLSGDLTLVGPRPRTRNEMDRLPLEVAQRLMAMKPGLAGFGTRVDWRSHEDWESILLAEIQYFERASEWQRLKLLARVVLDQLRVTGAV